MLHKSIFNKFKRQKGQKIFIVAASAATLLASGETTIINNYTFKSGDVTGDVTENDDSITIGEGGGVVATGSGNDTIVGGKAVDTISGGTGVDDVSGGEGLDNLVVIGTTLNAGYTVADLQNVAGTGVDLSSVLDLNYMNNHIKSDLSAGDSLDGGDDGAILFVFGQADFTGVSLANIYQIYLDNEVIISDLVLQTLKSTGLTDLLGDGTIRAETGLLDLDGVNVPEAVTIKDSDGNIILPTAATASSVDVAENSVAVGTFNVTDASAVGNVTYVLSGDDAALFTFNTNTGEVNFTAAPDYENAQDVGTDNVYNITVTATDEHLKSLAQDIVINVTDVDDDFFPSLYVANDYMRSGAEFLVNTHFENDQSRPSITSLIDGGYIIVWHSNDGQDDDMISSAIKAQIFDVEGNKTGTEFLVNSHFQGGQYNSSVTALSEGGFVITWHSNAHQDDDAEDTAIKAQIYDQAGAEVGDEFLVNSHYNDKQADPSITALNNGGFVITWRSDDHEGGGFIAVDEDSFAIKAQIYSQFGDEVGNEILVNSRFTNSQELPSIATLTGGNFVITWQSDDQEVGDKLGFAIKAQIYNQAGTPIGNEFLVNSHYQNDQTSPSITALSDGGFIIAWQSDDEQDADKSGIAIKAQIYDQAGVEVGTEFLVNTRPQNDQTSPAITALDGGGFVVTWQSDDQLSGDADESSIKLQFFNHLGQKVDNEFLANSSYNDIQQTPSITTLNDGGFVITWQSDDQQDADGFGSAIKAQQYDFAPIYKYETGETRSFDIGNEANYLHEGATLGNITISNIPGGISFSKGLLIGTTLTLLQADLTDLNIIFDAALNGRYALDISVTASSGSEDFTTAITIPISVGNLIEGQGFLNDSLTATNQSDHIEGQAFNLGHLPTPITDTDTLTLAGEIIDYSFAIVGNDIEVTHMASGTANIDLIHDIELLQFDTGLAVDVAALDDYGFITELSGTEYDAWLFSSYEFGAYLG